MWNPIRFNDLPDWLKREWNSDNFQIKTKLVKVYHDESISYKVLFPGIEQVIFTFDAGGDILAQRFNHLTARQNRTQC